MTNYYRLNDKYILRGWEKLPYAVVNTLTDKIDFIDAEHMNALKWCDGNTDITIPLVSDDERTIIREYVERGIVEPCEKGQSVSKEQEYKFYPVHYIKSPCVNVRGLFFVCMQYNYAIKFLGGNIHDRQHEEIRRASLIE